MVAGLKCGVASCLRGLMLVQLDGGVAKGDWLVASPSKLDACTRWFAPARHMVLQLHERLRR